MKNSMQKAKRLNRNLSFLAVLLILSVIATPTFSTLGIDVSQLHTEQTFKCFIEQNFTFLSVRAWKSFGGPDDNAAATLSNAQKAGLKDTSVYMFPCVSDSKSPVSQVTQMVDHLKGSQYNRIWLDIESNPSQGCGWTKDYSKNCKFLEDLAAAVRAAGKQVGIYASHYMWISIMGSVDNCNKFQSLPLWYAHYDHIASFEDFNKFGGWTKPTVKQFQGTTSMCGGSVDVNYKL